MNRETVILGGGCFWCLEAVFLEVEGVLEVESGYAGGTTPSPDYESVCGGGTGHAEVIRVVFDADRLPLGSLLEIFFGVHDPTTYNRQGHDVGTQYRSVIFSGNDEQLKTAKAVIAALTERRLFDDPIVTEVLPLTVFYPAEEYHQRYFERHPAQGYCRAVISPKLATFRREFASRRRVTV